MGLHTREAHTHWGELCTCLFLKKREGEKENRKGNRIEKEGQKGRGKTGFLQVFCSKISSLFPDFSIIDTITLLHMSQMALSNGVVLIEQYANDLSLIHI